MLAHTSTAAPWYVIPADHERFARLAAGAIIADILIGSDPRFPTIADTDRKAMRKEKAGLAAGEA